MARGLFRVASEPRPSETDPGTRLTCAGGWGAKECGLPMGWVVEPCDRDGCPGYWAWRCRTLPDVHGEPDDILELAAHGLSHDTREQELKVEKMYTSSCRCPKPDWEAGGCWAIPSNMQTITFACRGCGNTTPVNARFLRGPERDGPETKRPRGDRTWPCPCGRAMMQRDTDWIGPECVCCGGIIICDAANPARPLCLACQPNPRADEIVELVLAGKEDRRLRWLDQGQAVRVVIPRVVPRIGPGGQRLGGERLRDCRLRMMHAISDRMRMAGWASASRSNRLKMKYFVFRPRAGIRSPTRLPGTASWAW